MSHLISATQFNRESLTSLFLMADNLKSDRIIDPNRSSLLYVPPPAKSKILATLFFEPSTRTRLSFESAMLKLGGKVISACDSATCSAAKGESIEDTISTVSNYADLIVLRTPVKGQAAKAAAVSQIPIINAGDGTGEHPTQALLDLYTIKDHRSLDRLKVVICGDLLHGRTVHSLVRLLSHYKKLTLFLTSPKRLSLPDELVDYLVARRVNLFRYGNIREALAENPDVVYMTRLQKERMVDYAIHEDRWKDFCLTVEDVQKMPKDCLLMHPMPRNEEIPHDANIDLNERSMYLREQPRNGIAIRKSLIYLILNGKVPYDTFEH